MLTMSLGEALHVVCFGTLGGMIKDHVEIEDKYAVGPEVTLPELVALPDVASVSAPREHDLGATYFDTPALTLTAAGITLRRRTGGDDPGWHLKLPTSNGRYEVQLPLGPATRIVPAKLRELLVASLRGQDLAPIARVSTRRTVRRLMDSDGRVLAEVADDGVTTQALGQDGKVTSSRVWREWEVELVEGGPRVLRSAAELFRENGVEPSDSPSKLVEALGGRMPVQGSRPLPRKKSTSPGEVVMAWLGEQVAQLRRQDPLVRAGGPDAVHQMRVASRRLRSALATFRPLLDRDLTDPVRLELKWIAGVLGEARDAEMMMARLAELLTSEDPKAISASASTWVERILGDRYTQAHEASVLAMTSERYFALLTSLDLLLEEPPWTEDASDRSAGVLRKRVRHDWKRLRRRVRAVDDTRDEDERAQAMHEVRKAAKRVRYAAESLVPQYGRAAKRFVKLTKRVQSVLGDHQDSVVTQEELRKLGDAAVTDGDDSFTFGVLHAREARNQEATEEHLWAAWATAAKQKQRRWLKRPGFIAADPPGAADSLPPPRGGAA